MTASVHEESASDRDGRLTVVMVNFRSLANIEARLDSGALAGHDVIVVDNADDPAGVTRLCEAHRATPLLLDRNVGFAAAVNRAVATVEHPLQPWLLLNPDVDISTAELADLARHLGPGLDGVAPLLSGADGRLQIGAAGGNLTLAAVMAYFWFVSQLIPRLRGVFLTRRQSRVARRVAWLCMASLLVVPDAFERLGAVPETELVYAEDIAWGTAATARGACFELVPSIVLRHDQGASGASARWIGALERLCRQRLGPVRGRLAVFVIRTGLGARRMLGRRVT